MITRNQGVHTMGPRRISMPLYLGDKTGNHLALTIIAIDRTAEDNNCMLDVSVKSGNFTGATTLYVHYSDFVLFVYHLGMLVKDDIDIVPELQDQKWGSIIDVENTVGGLLYEDDNDGLQSVTFDFEIDDAKIHQFVTELKQDHFSNRNVNGLDFDFFTTALITLYPTVRFQLKATIPFSSVSSAGICRLGSLETNPRRRVRFISCKFRDWSIKPMNPSPN
jgi:hypothetical protein